MFEGIQQEEAEVAFELLLPDIKGIFMKFVKITALRNIEHIISIIIRKWK